jgi:hypothetical protein
VNTGAQTEANRLSVFEPAPRVAAYFDATVCTDGLPMEPSIGLVDTAYGMRTMRRTKAFLIYRRMKNLRTVQLLLGHTKLESTVRYLGIEVDDALEMAEQTEVWVFTCRRRDACQPTSDGRSLVLNGRRAVRSGRSQSLAGHQMVLDHQQCKGDKKSGQ